MRWTGRSLLIACEKLLKRSDCELRLRTITDPGITAHNEFSWDGSRATDLVLTVDPAQSSLVEGFLHEALHAVLVNELGHFDTALEEAIVKGLEQRLWLHTFKGGDVKRWRRLINAKLT